MSHADRKKKGGERKDKKNARMREDVQRRRENESPPGPETDKPDIQKHKPGSQGDRNMDPANIPRP